MTSLDLAAPDRKKIRQIFDSIAFRYDLINSFLSLRLDDGWRRRARDLVFEGTEQTILDLGIGTGKFLSLFLKDYPWEKAVGLDFSKTMLAESRRKLPAAVSLVSADFHFLPFQSGTFDLIISSFTLRSVKDMPGFLRDVYRLLRKNGKAVFLCLTRPQNLFCKLLYYPYLKYYLPLVGKLISGNQEAYQFLAQSIQTFQAPEETTKMMREAGFASAEFCSFTLGAATLIVGRK